MKARATFLRLVSVVGKIAPSLPRVLGTLLLAGAVAWAASALGQTNAETEVIPTRVPVNLTPVARIVRVILWSFAGILLAIAAAAAVFRYFIKPGAEKAAQDPHWQDDAQEEAAPKVGETEVLEACADFQKGAQAAYTVNPAEPEPQVVEEKKTRLYTPASGPAWTEPMLNAFIASCLKANCLGRAWQEEVAERSASPKSEIRNPKEVRSPKPEARTGKADAAGEDIPAAGQQPTPSRRFLDPREAELLRKLKARWHELEVDPDSGIFLEHVVEGSAKSHVCIIEVSREKHKVTHAALNAGFVVESLGRYLMSSDQVYPTRPGCYHAPDARELAFLAPEQKKYMIRVKNIPDPWKAMIGGLGSNVKSGKS
jgi:hypothetical protein